MIPTRESAVLSILTRQMMTGLKQCEPSNDEQDRITICGPKANATYLEPWDLLAAPKKSQLEGRHLHASAFEARGSQAASPKSGTITPAVARNSSSSL